MVLMEMRCSRTDWQATRGIDIKDRRNETIKKLLYYKLNLKYRNEKK